MNWLFVLPGPVTGFHCYIVTVAGLFYDGGGRCLLFACGDSEVKMWFCLFFIWAFFFHSQYKRSKLRKYPVVIMVMCF